MSRIEVFGKKTYLQAIAEKAGNKGKILSAMIELLDQCNYSCRYCYVRGSTQSLLPLDNVKKYLSELRDTGCVWLTLTGGEPLLHPNFIEIYNYAYDLGFAVTILTNGYLLTDEHIKLFQEKMPRVVDITLYGFNEKTYSEFVGKKDAFERFKHNLDLLSESNIHFELKATLTTRTYEYLAKYQEFAAEYGVRFRYDVMVVPALKDNRCLSLRLPPEMAIDFQLKQKDYLTKMKEQYEKASHQPINNSIYRCGGGVNYVFISSDQKMGFCAFERKYQYDLCADHATINAGHKWLMEQRLGVLEPSDKCFDCPLKCLCKYCPARFELESGNQKDPPTWYCECAQALFDAIQKECGKMANETI